MSRARHPNKHIEKAIRYAESLGWRVEVSGGHAWGRLFCPQSSREGCIVSVWSTPRIPENHARHIWREVDLCPHSGEPIGDDDNNEPEHNDDNA
ncbi:MAG TPA: hypothetical protein PKA76_19460 [Pirellulaceae bacterium]|nr:hypothetical protein [Pirellulaceae bacterium]